MQAVRLRPLIMASLVLSDIEIETTCYNQFSRARSGTSRARWPHIRWPQDDHVWSLRSWPVCPRPRGSDYPHIAFSKTLRQVMQNTAPIKFYDK
jgi:hypothetical protein